MSVTARPDAPTTDEAFAEYETGPSRTVGLNTSAVFAVTIVVQLIGYVATFFIAHGIATAPNDEGLNLWGAIQFFMIISSSVNTIGELRLSSAYTFYVARGRSPIEIARSFLVMRTIMVGVGGLILLLLASPIGLTAPGYGLSEADLLGVFAVFMVLPLLWSVQTVYTATRTATGDSLGGQIPIMLEAVVRTTGLVVVALPYTAFFHAPAMLNPTTVLWEMTGAYLVGALSSTAYCLPQVVRLRGHFHRSQVVEMFRYAWPLMGALILLYLSTSAVPIVVAGVLSKVALTYFNAANGFRILALALPAALAVPLFPHLAGLHVQRKFDLIRDRTWKSLRFTAMLLAPIVVALVVYRVPILNLFYGTIFTGPSNVPLALLVISAFPLALSQVIGTSLSAVGYQRLELYLTALMVAVMFVGFGILLWPFQLFGLAGLVAVSVAVLASSIAALGLNTYFMYRLLGVHLQPRPIVTVVAAGAASFYAVRQLNQYVSTWTWYELLAAFALGSVVYAFVLAVVGELSREDVQQLGTSMGVPTGVVRVLSALCWRRNSPPVNPMPADAGHALRPPPGSPPTEEPFPSVPEPPAR